MFEIDRHIESLLLRHSCVIVPGFGGFMVHHIGARYDETDGMMIPPMRTVGFNPQLTLNDSILVQSYIETYDISYPEALRQIESEVAELRMRLENDGFFDISSIGRIMINEFGQYEFEPCQAGILTPELYGLPGVEMQKLHSAKTQDEVSEEVSHDTIIIPLSDYSLEKPADGVKDADVTTSDDGAADDEVVGVQYPEGRASIYKLAVACLLLLIAFSIPFGLGSDSAKKLCECGFSSEWLSWIVPQDGMSERSDMATSDAKVADAKAFKEEVKISEPVVVSVPENETSSTTIESVSASDIAEPAAPVAEECKAVKEEKAAKDIKEASSREQKSNKEAAKSKVDVKAEVKAEAKKKEPVAKESASKETSLQPKKTGRVLYTIVLASSSNKLFAEDYVNNLHSRGYIAARVMSTGAQIRVVHGRYSSYEDARQMRDNLQQLPEFEHCWVLEAQ